MEGSSKKLSKGRAGSSKGRAASSKKPSNEPEFGGDCYRPQQFYGQQHQQFSQPHQQFVPQSYSQQQQFYSQPLPQTPMITPTRLDFSKEAMSHFDPFEPMRFSPQMQGQGVRQQPIYQDIDDEEERVQETQFDEGMNVDEEEEVDVNRKKKGKGRAERVEWSTEEEVALAKAYVHCSTDRKKGNERARSSLWKDVQKHYNQQLGGSDRTVHQLNSKWTKMLTSINLFNGFYIQAERLKKSGCNDLDAVERALKDFRDKKKVAFKNMEAWKVIKEHEKWSMIPIMGEESSEGSDKRRKSSESGYYVPPQSDPWEIPASMPDLNEDVGPRQPKRKEKKPVESSGGSMLSERLEQYASRKAAHFEELVSAKKELIAEQRHSLAEQQFERDFELFSKPHDHLPPKMQKHIIQRKRAIAKKYDWDMEGLESEEE